MPNATALPDNASDVELAIPSVSALSTKRRAFVLHYCGLAEGDDLRARWNGSEAARRAGYSPEAVNVVAAQLIAEPTVKTAIAEIQAMQVEQNSAMARRALEETYALATSNIFDVIDVRNNAIFVRDLDEIPYAAKAAVSEVTKKIGPDGTVTWKVKLHSKTAALQLLLKAIGVLRDPGTTTNINVGVGVSVDNNLERIRRALGIRTDSLESTE